MSTAIAVAQTVAPYIGIPQLSNSRIITMQPKLSPHTLYFQYLPETLEETKAVNWNQTEIIGRSHPVVGFASSAPRNISFTLQFFANPEPGIEMSPAQVANAVTWCRALTYPHYGAGVAAPPSLCHISIAGGAIYMVGVVESVSVNYLAPWTGGPGAETAYHHAEINMSFTEAPARAINARSLGLAAYEAYGG